MADETLIDKGNDDWWSAVSLFTGYTPPSVTDALDQLKSHDGIPFMHVTLEKAGNNDLPEDEETAWQDENFYNEIGKMHFKIPFYTYKDGDLTKHHAWIQLIGIQDTKKGIDEGGGKDSFKESDVDSEWGGDDEKGDTESSWDTSQIAQYSYGSGEALRWLLEKPHGTKGFNWNPAVTDSTFVDPSTFESTALAFDRFRDFVGARKEILEGWEKTFGKTENDKWKGQAAGVWWNLVHLIVRRYERLADDMQDTANRHVGLAAARGSKQAAAVRYVGMTLRDEAQNLRDAWESWVGDHRGWDGGFSATVSSNPLYHLVDILGEIMYNIWMDNLTKAYESTESNPSGYTSLSAGYSPDTTSVNIQPGFSSEAKDRDGKLYGQLDLQDTWKKIGEEAKTRWWRDLREKLGGPGETAKANLKSAIATAVGDIGEIRPASGQDLQQSLQSDQADRDRKEAADERAKQEAENERIRKEMEEQRAEDLAAAEAERARQDKLREEAEAKADKQRAEDLARQKAEQERQDKLREEAEAKADKQRAEDLARQEELRKEQEAKQEELRKEQEAKEKEQEAKQEELRKEQEAKEEELRKEQEAKEKEQEAKQEQRQKEQEQRAAGGAAAPPGGAAATADDPAADHAGEAAEGAAEAAGGGHPPAGGAGGQAGGQAGGAGGQAGGQGEGAGGQAGGAPQGAGSQGEGAGGQAGAAPQGAGSQGEGAGGEAGADSPGAGGQAGPPAGGGHPPTGGAAGPAGAAAGGAAGQAGGAPQGAGGQAGGTAAAAGAGAAPPGRAAAAGAASSGGASGRATSARGGAPGRATPPPGAAPGRAAAPPGAVAASSGGAPAAALPGPGRRHPRRSARGLLVRRCAELPSGRHHRSRQRRRLVDQPGRQSLAPGPAWPDRHRVSGRQPDHDRSADADVDHHRPRRRLALRTAERR
ncbi:AAWKG family protein [Streptomyces sp. GKU 257-1]|nr:AAWKG family protein [Streptomyces sp. GKU 257-1]